MRGEFKVAQQRGWGLNTNTSTSRSSSCAASHFSPSALLLASCSPPSNPSFSFYLAASTSSGMR